MKYEPRPLVETADISRGKATFESRVKTVISAIIVLATLYLLLGLVAEFLARAIPDRWERKLSGVGALAETTTTNQLEHAQAILRKLTNEESLRDLDYGLFVLELKQPNAVAVPGGGIGVTPELLESVKSETGLAFVLAHELGHHQNRHILRAFGRRLIIGLAAALLFNYDGLSSVNAAVELAESGYSRKQERAADAFALQLVHKKYGDTTGALEFFEFMQERGGDHFWEKYAGTHPPTVERIEELKALQNELKRK